MIYDAVMTIIYRTYGALVDLLPAAESAPSWVSDSFGYVYSLNELLPVSMVGAYLTAWVGVETSIFVYRRVQMMWKR